MIASLPLGTYEADFMSDFTNSLGSHLPAPTPENVRVILDVVNYPTVNVSPPLSLSFNVTQVGLAPPVQPMALTATSIPAMGIPFTVTPSGSPVVLQENGIAVPSISGLLLPGNSEVD